MNKFVWTSEYSLGILTIDEQHKHFFEIVNKIYDLLESKNNNKDEILKIVTELVDYAYFHLSTEEKYFNQFAYSDISNHMKYHTFFREKSQEYLDRIRTADTNLPELILEIDNFSKDWLSHHILVADKMYAPLFKAHGLI